MGLPEERLRGMSAKVYTRPRNTLVCRLMVHFLLVFVSGFKFRDTHISALMYTHMLETMRSNPVAKISPPPHASRSSH
jgi:hypothetical protein